jgi:hypothetical protein
MTTPDPPRRSRAQWLADLDAEIERRRRAVVEAAGGDPRQQLLAKLTEMSARLRAAPDYRPLGQAGGVL